MLENLLMKKYLFILSIFFGTKMNF